MGGVQVGNLLNQLGAGRSIDRAEARREVVRYLNEHLESVAVELENHGEAFIETSSGAFRLTKEDLAAA